MTTPVPRRTPTSDRVRVADLVLETARTDPHRVAMVQVGRGRVGGPTHREWTYAELSDRAERLALGLRVAGVREGTLCSFMVPPSFSALVLGTALFRVGATLVGVEPYSHGLRRVGHCLDRVGPEVFFGTPRAHWAKKLFGWGRRTVRQEFVVDGFWPGMRSLDELLVDHAPDEPVPADVEPGDPAVIAFTTGSTGPPKPTVLRQRNFAAMVDLVSAQWSLGDGGDVVDMPTFPMFWIIALSVGGRVVVPPMDFTVKGPADADPAALLRTMQGHGVRSMFGSPALLRNLSAYARRESITVRGVRRVVAGGAEVQGPLYAAVRDMLGPEGELYSDYGATEALPLCEIDGTTVLRETWKRTERGEGLCVGPGLPGVELRIIPATEEPIANLEDVEVLPTGEIGEVIARSPHISEDYFHDPASTAANKIADPDGSVWHRLGDVGHLDERGRLWLGGRRSHRVITRQRVYLPLRVEPVIATHPAVRRAALVGVPRAGGIAPVVCVERDEGDRRAASTVAIELRELAASHESTRGLSEFVEVRRLPVDRRHNAKIDRPALGARMARRLGRGTGIGIGGDHPPIPSPNGGP